MTKIPHGEIPHEFLIKDFLLWVESFDWVVFVQKFAHNSKLIAFFENINITKIVNQENMHKISYMQFSSTSTIKDVIRV